MRVGGTRAPGRTRRPDATVARTFCLSFTYAAGGQQPLRIFGRLAVRVHGLQHVQAERERDDGLGTRAHDHALHPQPHERHERAERLHDVRVVGPGLGYHAAQLGVTVRAHLETIWRVTTNGRCHVG